jgi:hypothetical protein
MELWSLSVSLCDNKWLQLSPSPVRLQDVRWDPSHCCNLLSVELVLMNLKALDALVEGLLGSQTPKELT